MIILRQKDFSAKPMIDRITAKLEKNGIDDYEVTSRIPDDVISILPDPSNLKIYIPLDNEYAQYGIDDFIRGMVSYLRTTTVLDRNIYVQKVSGRMNEDQIYKLVRHIIDEEGFCALVENEKY